MPTRITFGPSDHLDVAEDPARVAETIAAATDGWVVLNRYRHLADSEIRVQVGLIRAYAEFKAGRGTPD